MVKNLDRLSDLLCGVIDLAELVRNVHPDPAWASGANAAYEELCEYMNELNTHVGLYEVSWKRYRLASPAHISRDAGPQIAPCFASSQYTI